MKRNGIGSHTLPNGGQTDIWLTPPAILHGLGTFDLDPCAAPSPRPWETAIESIELPRDGLAEPWHGRVWCNPPYGPETARWLDKLATHGIGTALVFARTETDYWFEYIWPKASAILFIRNRLNFYLPDGTRANGNAGGPSALVAYGQDDARLLAHAGIDGRLIVTFNGGISA